MTNPGTCYQGSKTYKEKKKDSGIECPNQDLGYALLIGRVSPWSHPGPYRGSPATMKIMPPVIAMRAFFTLSSPPQRVHFMPIVATNMAKKPNTRDTTIKARVACRAAAEEEEEGGHCWKWQVDLGWRQPKRCRPRPLTPGPWSACRVPPPAWGPLVLVQGRPCADGSRPHPATKSFPLPAPPCAPEPARGAEVSMKPLQVGGKGERGRKRSAGGS